MTSSKQVTRIWYKATLTPMAQGLFTEAFYPTPKKGSGNQYVFFTQADITPSCHKIIVASKMAESGLRMLTQDLARACLIPTTKATKAEMLKLDKLSENLKL